MIASWQDLMRAARDVLRSGGEVTSLGDALDLLQDMCRFLTEEERLALAAERRWSDHIELERTLTIVQARCTDLLEENCLLKEEAHALRALLGEGLGSD